MKIKKKEYWCQVYDYKKNTINSEWRARFIKDIVLKNVDKVGSILELGCGSGCNLMEIKKFAPNVRLCGIELNEKAIVYGKEIEKNMANLICGDLRNLTRFEDKSFDLVLTSGVLLYLGAKEVMSVLKEATRIAKKFIFCIEFHGKKNLLEQVIKGRDYKISIHQINYIDIFNKIGYSAKTFSMASFLPNAKIKNSKHLVVVNLTEDELAL